MKKRHIISTSLSILVATMITGCFDDVTEVDEGHAPVITVLGSNPLEVKQTPTTYTDAGATANDAEDGDLTSQLITSGVDAVDASTIGNYTVTYSVEDSDGNEVEDTRTVNVTANIPVITVTGSNPVNIFVGDTYVDEGATATDVEDGDVEVVVTNDLDTSKVGAYTYTYAATDSDGNKAKEQTRTVNVAAVPDTTAPVVTLIGDAIVVQNFGHYVDEGATATDDVDGDLTPVVSPEVNASIPGHYIVTYTATDAAGNEGTATRDVTINECQNVNPITGGCEDSAL